MNITDIDDKIIINSAKNNEDFSQYARKWEKEFFEDMKYKSKCAKVAHGIVLKVLESRPS